MYPELFSIGEWLPVTSYFTFIALGYLLGVALAWFEGRRVGIDPDDVIDIGLWGLIFALIGARLLHVLFDGYLMDYVHLCTDPFLVEGRDLLGYPVAEAEALGQPVRRCVEDAQCLSSSDKGWDVGPVCNEETGLCHPEQDCLKWAKFWEGGLVFYGAMIGSMLHGLWFCYRHRVGALWAPNMVDLKKPDGLFGGVRRFVRMVRTFPTIVLRMLDVASPSFSLGLLFGRAACFLAGCCFGTVTDGPLGVRFPEGSAAHSEHRKEHSGELQQQLAELGEHMSLAVHPTQLYAVVNHTIIFAILYFWVRRRKRFHGQVFAVFFLLTGLQRFVVEFFRADSRGSFAFLSTSQWISLAIVIIGVLVLRWGLANSKSIVDDGAWPPLGKRLDETVYKPVEAEWDGVKISPIMGWRAKFDELADKKLLRKREVSGYHLSQGQPASEDEEQAVDNDREADQVEGQDEAQSDDDSKDNNTNGDNAKDAKDD